MNYTMVTMTAIICITILLLNWQDGRRKGYLKKRRRRKAGKRIRSVREYENGRRKAV